MARKLAPVILLHFSRRSVYALRLTPKEEMANISIASYIVTVRRRRSKTKELLGNFEGTDLRDEVRTFFSSRKSPIHNKARKNLLQASVRVDEGDEISGIIRTGEYGHGSLIVDSDRKKLSYKRKPTDAEVLPFFFQFYLPPKEHFGLLLLQRFKTFGIRKIVAGDFIEFFSSRHPETLVHFNPIVHPKLLKEFSSRGKATKIKFRRHEIPQDVCDAFKNKISPGDGYVEYSIVARKEGSFNRLSQMFGGLGEAAPLSIPAPENFTDARRLVEMSLNGRKRTVDIANIQHLRTYFDVTDQLEFDSDAQPKFSSIHAVSKELLFDIWSFLKGTAADVFED